MSLELTHSEGSVLSSAMLLQQAGGRRIGLGAKISTFRRAEKHLFLGYLIQLLLQSFTNISRALKTLFENVLQKKKLKFSSGLGVESKLILLPCQKRELEGERAEIPAIPCGRTRDEADNIWRVRGRGSDRERGAFLYFAKTRERADNCNSLPSRVLGGG